MPMNEPAASFRGNNSRVDNITAAVVDRGVEFHKTLGRTVATAYCKENHVPEPVIRRILGIGQQRRALPAPPMRRY